MVLFYNFNSFIAGDDDGADLKALEAGVSYGIKQDEYRKTFHKNITCNSYGKGSWGYSLIKSTSFKRTNI